MGRSKAQRWQDTPASRDSNGELLEKRAPEIMDGELLGKRAPGTMSSEPPRRRAPGNMTYKEAVLRLAKESARDLNLKQLTPTPLQPPQIRLRSEIHRISEAAADSEEWRVVTRRRSRRSVVA